ncbi:unnamed protein product [Diabrotica balteata]|uniref:Uncharacterized protein n=1 Tax=Diabrotica balteata TaxID=107213 RepID=A0A9N9SR75_DIABA|nr:unnamed protein product [Diabrotica balteata]
MTLYRPLFCIVLSVVYLSLTATARNDCGPHYCDNIRPKCVVANCTANQIKKTYPPLCRCCPECYTIKDEDEPCGEEIYAVCGPHLKCYKKVCIKIRF